MEIPSYFAHPPIGAEHDSLVQHPTLASDDPSFPVDHADKSRPDASKVRLDAFRIQLPPDKLTESIWLLQSCC